MAEEGELTSEAIQELANATNNLASAIQSSNSSGNDILLAFIPAIAIVLGIVAAIWQFKISQKAQNKIQEKHNAAQELAEIQFNETEKRSKDLEFMQQLELYNAKFIEVSRKFANSDRQFNNCTSCAKGWLTILDIISFLRTKNLVDDTFVQFFEFNFNVGRTFLKWLKFTNTTISDWNDSYVNFNKIIDDNIIDFVRTVATESPFYYYVHECYKDKEYKPHEDKTDTKTYIPTPEDIDLIDPKE